MKRRRRSFSQRLTRLRGDMRTVTPFVVACGLVALFYFLYRGILLTIPAVSIEQSIFNPHGDASIVCSEEGGVLLKDPAPVISSGYQDRIRSTPSLSPNLVTNADLSQVDSDTAEPIGFEHTIENETVVYEHIADSDGTPFLRVTSSASSPSMPAWEMSPITTAPHHTYAYSFWYRASKPVDVTYVTTQANGLHYTYEVTLPNTTQWTQFSAEYTADESVQSFYVLAMNTEKGVLDTRGYDIHQIPDAALQEPLVSVTFDDGWESTYKKALPLLEKYGILTTQYIIADVAAHNVYDYMNLNEIKQLHDKGHEIGSHSLRHCDQVVLDPTTMTNDAVTSKSILEKQVGSIRSFAYPLGQYNQATQATYEKYYPLIRTSDVGYNDRYFDATNIHSMAVLSTTTNEAFSSWIQYAKTHGVWVVLAYHRVDATGKYSVTSAQLEAQLSLLKSSGVKVLTVNAAATIIRP